MKNKNFLKRFHLGILNILKFIDIVQMIVINCLCISVSILILSILSDYTISNNFYLELMILNFIFTTDFNIMISFMLKNILLFLFIFVFNIFIMAHLFVNENKKNIIVLNNTLRQNSKKYKHIFGMYLSITLGIAVFLVTYGMDPILEENTYEYIHNLLNPDKPNFGLKTIR